MPLPFQHTQVGKGRLAKGRESLASTYTNTHSSTTASRARAWLASYFCNRDISSRIPDVGVGRFQNKSVHLGSLETNESKKTPQQNVLWSGPDLFLAGLLAPLSSPHPKSPSSPPSSFPTNITV